MPEITIETLLNKYNTRYGCWMAYFDEKMTLSEARLWEELYSDPESLKSYLFLRIYREIKVLIDSYQDDATNSTR